MSLLPDSEPPIIIPIQLNTSQVDRATQEVVQDAQKMKQAYENVGDSLKKIFPGIAEKIDDSVKGLQKGVEQIERQVLATNKLIAAEDKLSKTRNASQAKARVSSATSSIASELSFADRLAAEKARANAPTTNFARAQGAVSALKEEQDFLQRVSDEKQRYAKASEVATTSSKKLEDQTKKTSSSFSSMINVVKGAITAMLTLAALRKVSEFFTGALESAQAFRAQMVQLNFSEVILSKKGMDITRQELDDFISYIEGRYQYLSKLDATKVVSETAGAVQEFDVSLDQLKALSDSIAYIQLQNKLLGREEADAAHIINAAMDARSNFFNGMGINITETIVKEKAYKMGLVEVGEELTKQQRFQAILALLTEQTSGKQKELLAALEGTALGNQLKFQKDYEDVLEKVGEQLLSVKDKFLQLFTNINANGEVGQGLIQTFTSLATEINNTLEVLGEAVDAIQTLEGGFGNSQEAGEGWLHWILDAINPLEIIISSLQTLGALLATVIMVPVTFWSDIFAGRGIGTALKNAGIMAGETFVAGFSTAIETLLGDENGKIATWIKDQWKKITGVDINALHTPKVSPSTVPNSGPDTPTGSTMADGVEAESDNVQKAVEKMHEEVLDEYLKMQQAIEDANVDFNRKMDDISSEYQFKRLDANQEYNNKVEDINRDGNRKLQDLASKHAQAEAKAREDNLNKEREYQNKLLEMREEFLMDLDDALHARDARQILKLIKQYNLDKTQAQRQRELQKQEAASEAKLRQQAYDAERKEAEIEKRRKLEDAAIAHQEKLAQLAEEEERERLQAQLDQQRKLQDLETNMQQRLALLGAGLVAEFDLTKQGLDAVLALYTAYYGPGGAVEAIYQGMLGRLASQTPPTSNALPPGANPDDPQSQPGGYGNQNGSMFKFAKGGTLIANRPTSVLMGEAGPEIATFTPIKKQGTDVNKVFSNMSGGSNKGMKGELHLEFLLSPDLEARVVKNSMEGTAKIISRVIRSK